MVHVIFSFAAFSLLYTRESQWAFLLWWRLCSELLHNAVCFNSTEIRSSSVCVRVFGTEGGRLLDIWRVTWWKRNGPVSCVWHFDPGHWSPLAHLWSVCMSVRPYVRTDVFWQIHARERTDDSCLSLLVNTRLGTNIHTSMWSHDKPECVQSGDNRSPRAMSLRSSWWDTRRQMLRAKGTLSSPRVKYVCLIW